MQMNLLKEHPGGFYEHSEGFYERSLKFSCFEKALEHFFQL